MSMADDIHPDASSSIARDGDSGPTIKLAVFCPQRPLQHGVQTADVAELYTVPEKLEVPSASTVKDLKAKLEQTFPGGPLATAQSLLWHGRRLSDDEVLQQVVQGTQQPEMGYVLHLTCPAEMWKSVPLTATSTSSIKTSTSSAAERLSALSASLTPSTSPIPPQLQPSAFVTPGPRSTDTQPPLTSIQAIIDGSISPPSFTSISSVVPVTSSFNTAQWKTYSTHLSALSPTQRADFVGRVSRAERYYATLSKVASERQGPQMTVIGEEQVQQLRESGRIGTGFSSQSVKEMEDSIEQLLDDLGCIASVCAAESKAAEEFDAIEKTQIELLGGQSSSRVVYISGYPFLLQIPPQFAVPAKERKEAFIQLKKYQAVHMLLSTMLSIARNLQQAHGTGQAGFSSSYQIPPFARARDAHQFNGQIPPVAGIAMQQGLNRPNGLGGVGIGAQAAARLAGPGMPTARLAVVINLDEIMALAMPLLFLSVKLAFLIYVFGKHATTRKRIVMCVMALAWVIWEGTSIHRRRRAAETRRQQQRVAEQGGLIPPHDRIRIRMVEGNLPNGPGGLEPPQNLDAHQDQPNNAGQGGQPGPQDRLPPALTQLQQRLQDLGNQELRRRVRNGENPPDEARRQARNGGTSSSRSSSHRQPPSRMSPKYWLYLLAKVGLSAEARDMGLSRSVLRQMQISNRQQQQASQNGSTPIPPLLPAQVNEPGTPSAIREYQSQPLTLERALRNLYIGIILFIGTLIPEVERLRKKALLKREKKLSELELTRRQIHLANLQSELRRLEDQRKFLESQIGLGEPSQSFAEDTQQVGQSAAQTREDASSSKEDSSLDVSGNQAATGVARRPTGLGINAMHSSDSDSELFDPPFQKKDIQAALTSPTVTRDDNDRRTSSGLDKSTLSASTSASTTTEPPRIRIDTDAERPNDLLSPLHALQGQGQQRRDENGNLIIEDDYSAPSTPLLSPAMTEEEDDRQDEGGDDDVGMILF